MLKTNTKLFAKLAHGFANDPKIVGLSDAAFRAYIEALLYSCQHMTDGFLDERIVARFGWAAAAEELTSNDAEPSWVCVDGGFVIYAFCEWQMTSAAHQKKVEAGRAGGLAKAQAKQAASKTLAGAKNVLEQNASKTLLEEDIDKDIEIKPSAIASPYFERWWTEYPRKVAKGTALKAFNRAIVTTSFDLLMDSVKAYAIRVANTEQQYILHAATWLNQERWHDEPEPARHNPDAWMNEVVKWGPERGE
jgi:hypothetical protein